MTKIERAIAEIKELKARVERLETAPSEMPGGATMSDVEKTMFIREAVRRDNMGDSSMRKAWNRRNAPQGNHKGLPLQRRGD